MSNVPPSDAGHQSETGRNWAAGRSWIRIGFGVIASGFLLSILTRRWSEVHEQLELSPVRLLGCILLVVLSVSALARAWATLLPPSSDGRRMRRVFYLAQPAKYVPGGVAQILGQVALTTGEGVAAAKAAAAFAVHALVGAVAGALIGSGVILLSTPPTWLRLLAAAGVVAPVTLWRPFLTRPIQLVARFATRRVDLDLIPTQRQILVAFAWALLGLCAVAGSFAVVGANTIRVPEWQIAQSFALAFTVGYLALPFPSGIGVREGVLALALGNVGLATVTAVSAIHRVLTMAGELLLVVATSRSR